MMTQGRARAARTGRRNTQKPWKGGGETVVGVASINSALRHRRRPRRSADEDVLDKRQRHVATPHGESLKEAPGQLKHVAYGAHAQQYDDQADEKRVHLQVALARAPLETCLAYSGAGARRRATA